MICSFELYILFFLFFCFLQNSISWCNWCQVSCVLLVILMVTAPCNLVGGCQNFGGICHLGCHFYIESGNSIPSERLATTNESTRGWTEKIIILVSHVVEEVPSEPVYFLSWFVLWNLTKRRKSSHSWEIACLLPLVLSLELLHWF